MPKGKESQPDPQSPAPVEGEAANVEISDDLVARLAAHFKSGGKNGEPGVTVNGETLSGGTEVPTRTEPEGGSEGGEGSTRGRSGGRGSAQRQPRSPREPREPSSGRPRRSARNTPPEQGGGGISRGQEGAAPTPEPPPTRREPERVPADAVFTPLPTTGLRDWPAFFGLASTVGTEEVRQAAAAILRTYDPRRWEGHPNHAEAEATYRRAQQIYDAYHHRDNPGWLARKQRELGEEPTAPPPPVPSPRAPRPATPPPSPAARAPIPPRTTGGTLDTSYRSDMLSMNSNYSNPRPSMSPENPFLSFAAQKDADENRRAEKIDERPTLSDILARESKQFGEMLASADSPEMEELGQRLLSRTLEADDMVQLAELREEYLKRKAAGERVNEAISDDEVDELTSYSKDFAELRNIVGTEALRTIIRAGIVDKAISNPDMLRDLERKQKQLEKIKQQAEPANAYLRRISKEYELSSPASIVEAMMIEDRGEREAALQAALISEKGFLGKLFDRFRGGSKREAGRIADEAESFDTLRQDRARIMKESGLFIANLVSDDPAMRDSLTQALYKERLSKTRRERAPALKELSSKVPTEEGVQAAWTEFRPRNWGNLDEPARTAARERFEREYKQRHIPPQQDFWSKMLGIFCADLFTPENLA